MPNAKMLTSEDLRRIGMPGMPGFNYAGRAEMEKLVFDNGFRIVGETKQIQMRDVAIHGAGGQKNGLRSKVTWDEVSESTINHSFPVWNMIVENPSEHH